MGNMSKEEYEQWYKSCKFIRQELQFYSWEDFITQAESFKILYASTTPLIKQLYKWYVMANPNVSFKRKCGIWDYINGYASYEKIKDI